MHNLIAITSALSDPNRLRILHALMLHQELCVCQLHELLQLAPSTTSRHLSLLHTARLVDFRKEGRWAYYRLSTDSHVPEQQAMLTWVCRRVAETQQGSLDKKSLLQILKHTREELSQLQADGMTCCTPVPNIKKAIGKLGANFKK